MAPRGPTLASKVVLGLCLWLYRMRGWRLRGQAPDVRKCVIIGAPHTTNWDFIFFLGATRSYGIRPSFMGKHSLFRWPLTRFMLDMGGLPVDRSARANYVDQVAAEFARRDDLMLVIAPEGTRKPVPHWRSGFYHIALAAGVPIVPAWVDHERMEGGLGPPVWPSGDYAADMARIAAFYHDMMPGHPRLAAVRAAD
ncbi:MAG TPA: lysophospholipid acyltransferase family protein [Novosphingobium sp.]|nr:lysophospholipid acyltransferase family protein [Novosphingobium sp.]